MATNMELTKLMMICSANYKGWPEEGKEEATLTLWDMTLSDIPVEVLKNAVVAHISTNVFPPTVANLKEYAVKFITGPQMDWSSAWELITGAVRRYGFYREAEGLASLPTDVAIMAKRFTWREICMNENVDTLRAQFRMAWETEGKRAKEISLMPPAIAAMLESPNLVKRLE